MAQEMTPVLLRLGDVVFATTFEALRTAGGMLGAMFAHGNLSPGTRDPATGAVLIHRDPALFGFVLQHVHGERVGLDLLSAAGLGQLGVECGYYVLPGLADDVARALAAREDLARRQERGYQYQLWKQRSDFERDLELVYGKYKDPGCLVQRATVKSGERVTRRAGKGSGYPNRSTRQRQGTVTCVTDRTEDTGTVGVTWDDGLFQSDFQAGKRGVYDLEYAR
jgi:hypothetical protein